MSLLLPLFVGTVSFISESLLVFGRPILFFLSKAQVLEFGVTPTQARKFIQI